MNTTDLIALMRATPAITDLVGQDIYDRKVPTLDANTGSVDLPFIWVRASSQRQHDIQNPIQGEAAFSKSFDVEAVADTATEEQSIVDAIYTLHGYRGVMSAAHVDGFYVIDQDADYAVRSLPADAGVFVGSLLITIVGE